MTIRTTPLSRLDNIAAIIALIVSEEACKITTKFPRWRWYYIKKAIQMMRTGFGGTTLTGVDEKVSSGTVTLPLMAYRPDTPTGAAVILCPGGITTGMFEIMEWIGKRLRDAGIFALTISYRGTSPEYDPDDILLVKDWLKKQPGVDGNRIAVLGMSRGGNAAMRAAPVIPDLKTVITFGAATNFLQQAEGTKVYAPGRHQMLVDWLGDPVTNRAFYEQIQAISYADQIRQPVLLIHGQHDLHCTPEQSIWMKAAIETGGNNNVRLELIPMMCHYADVIPYGYGFDTLASIIIPFCTDNL